MKKIEAFLIVVIVGLIGYLAYDLYGMPIDFSSGKTTELIQSGEEPKIESKQTEEILTEEARVEETREEQEKESDLYEETVTLPSAYDARQNGRSATIKNQGELGTCWAFAASSALEAALLPDEQLIFSPDHISLQNGYDKNQDEGGAYNMTMAYLTSWKGPVLEEEDPYGDGYSPDGLQPVKHVQEIQMVKDRDYEEIKRAVYLYGAVQSSLHMDMQGNRFSSIYYNELQYAYCYTGEENANHDILIIGWDDDYPAENFTYATQKGAFICQNSWGDEFAEQGIFYVSYSDKLIGNNCTAITKIESANNYDNIYQSDLCGWIGQLGYDRDTCYFANVYESEANETVEAVGFYATDVNTSYEVYLMEAYEGSISMEGIRKVQSGKLKNAGFYTIDLKESIPIKEHQKFAVIVKITTPGSVCPVAAEYKADETMASVDVSDGEGYISPNGNNWVQTEEEYGCNICLKVYSKAV